MNILALFCEDIRDEVGGTVTLVGILPDNMNVRTQGSDEPADKLMAKLCIYARINFDPDDAEIGSGVLQLTFPDGSVQTLGEIDKQTLDTARRNAHEKGNVQAGVVLKVVLGGLAVARPGQMKVEFVLPAKTHLAGGINFIALKKSEATSSAP